MWMWTEFLGIWTHLSRWFWNPYVWLPEGYSWVDLTPNEKVQYPVWSDLWTYPLFMAVIALGLRFLILNKLIFGPLATRLGLKETRPKLLYRNDTLENLFRLHGSRPSVEAVQGCAKKMDWTSRQVERWLRDRTGLNKMSKHTKFMECAWQLLYYTCSFSYGIYVLTNKPWLYDISLCWKEYPHHSVDQSLWWYYMVSMSFYWSMVFTHFFETKRKDFWQMFLHHCVTLGLMTFSWTTNFVRIGSIILVLHDCADIPLHLAKVFIYLEHKAACDATFALFAVTWVVTRDAIYPFWVVRSTMTQATTIIPIFPAYYVFNGLLTLLLLLHFYWTYFIFRIVANTMVKGKMTDDRSSSSQEENEELYSDIVKGTMILNKKEEPNGDIIRDNGVSYEEVKVNGDVNLEREDNKEEEPEPTDTEISQEAGNDDVTYKACNGHPVSIS